MGSAYVQSRRQDPSSSRPVANSLHAPCPKPPDHHPGCPEASSDLSTSSCPRQDACIEDVTAFATGGTSQPRWMSGSQDVQDRRLHDGVADLVLSTESSSPTVTLRCLVLVCEPPRARHSGLLSTFRFATLVVDGRSLETIPRVLDTGISTSLYCFDAWLRQVTRCRALEIVRSLT